LAYYLGASSILTFWIGYVLTRPLGASLGDLLSQSPNYGGFGLGTIVTSAIFLATIIALVVWVSLTGHGQSSPPPRAGTAPSVPGSA
jgi:uncharacterized membrane-anchored protein